MPSLRDKVDDAIRAGLTEWYGPHPQVTHTAGLPAFLTGRVFEAMADQRPCVTCGKGLGPAKVAKGYVQCYDCVRLRRPVP